MKKMMEGISLKQITRKGSGGWPTRWRFASLLAVSACCLLFIGCNPLYGFIFDNSKLSQVQVGVTTRAQVAKLLGRPRYAKSYGDREQLLYFAYWSVTRPAYENIVQSVSPISQLFIPKNATVELQEVAIEIERTELVGLVCTVTESDRIHNRPIVLGGGVTRVEGGREVTPGEAALIKYNVTTRDDVAALLGPPQEECAASEEFYWVYRHRYGSHNIETFSIHFTPAGTVIRTNRIPHGSRLLGTNRLMTHKPYMYLERE